MDGGSNGTANVLELRRPIKARAVPRSFAHIDLKSGDILRVVTGGGGGWGDARHREPFMIEQDLQNGLLSEAEASELYGYDRRIAV